MRIGVLADTHTNSLERLPKTVVDTLSGTDLIIHAGDYTEKQLVDELRKLGNFKGVFGNMDSAEIRRELPTVEIIEVRGFRIAVNHPAEGGAPFGLQDRLSTKFQKVHAIIFGHSHQAKSERRNEILFFNPGSATGTFPALKKTFGILTVDTEIRAEIVKV